mmetsp:Transcript_24348/g.67708  ORF Transcript_24348/g.67708 Transcript_24348/m.67708 type:complete len:81 (-) Transcript_24348:75-317(-)
MSSSRWHGGISPAAPGDEARLETSAVGAGGGRRGGGWLHARCKALSFRGGLEAAARGAPDGVVPREAGDPPTLAPPLAEP